jgi:hypothetical protein
MLLRRSIYKPDEVNEYHKGYLKLMHQDNLNQVYEEIGDDDIEHFVRLYKVWVYNRIKCICMR